MGALTGFLTFRKVFDMASSQLTYIHILDENIYLDRKTRRSLQYDPIEDITC